MNEAAPRYGLARNPFIHQALTSTDPNTEDVAPLEIDGFRYISSGELDAYLAKQRHEALPAYVLIQGASGIGRTSAARNILKRYGTAAGITPGNGQMIAPHVDPNHSPVDMIQRWVRQVRKAVGSARFSAPANRSFEEVLIYKTCDSAFCGKLEDLFEELNSSLGEGSAPLAFGFCSDNTPETFPYQELIKNVFANISVIVVFVPQSARNPDPDDPLLAMFREISGWIFPHNPLSCEDVKTLAEAKWREVAGPSVRCPIHPDSITWIHETIRDLTLHGYLDFLAFTLENKAIHSNGKTLWPDDAALEIQAADVERTFRAYKFFREQTLNRKYWH